MKPDGFDSARPCRRAADARATSAAERERSFRRAVVDISSLVSCLARSSRRVSTPSPPPTPLLIVGSFGSVAACGVRNEEGAGTIYPSRISARRMSLFLIRCCRVTSTAESFNLFIPRLSPGRARLTRHRGSRANNLRAGDPTFARPCRFATAVGQSTRCNCERNRHRVGAKLAPHSFFQF